MVPAPVYKSNSIAPRFVGKTYKLYSDFSLLPHAPRSRRRKCATSARLLVPTAMKCVAPGGNGTVRRDHYELARQLVPESQQDAGNE